MNNSTLRLTVLAGLVTAIAGHASPGLASHWVPPEPYLVYTNIIGWSEDNRFLVYEQGPEDESGLQYENSKTRWHIVSVRNGKESLLTKPEFNAWTKSNRLPEIAETSRMSPVGRIESLIIATQGNWSTVQADDNGSTWKIEKWNGKPIRGVLEKNYYLLDTSERVNKRIDSYTFIPPKDAVEVRISPIWSNDGRRIAWFMHGLLVHLLDKKGGFKLENFNEVFIDRTWGPRIQIASKGLAPETIDKITTVIEQLGFAPTSEKEEPRQRAKSVVYARKGFQEEAKKIAAVIPGGATVQALKQKGRFDIVVALGTPAISSSNLEPSRQAETQLSGASQRSSPDEQTGKATPKPSIPVSSAEAGRLAPGIAEPGGKKLEANTPRTAPVESGEGDTTTTAEDQNVELRNVMSIGYLSDPTTTAEYPKDVLESSDGTYRQERSLKNDLIKRGSSYRLEFDNLLEGKRYTLTEWHSATNAEVKFTDLPYATIIDQYRPEVAARLAELANPGQAPAAEGEPMQRGCGCGGPGSGPALLVGLMALALMKTRRRAIR